MKIPRHQIVVQVSAELRQRLKIVAAERGVSLREMVMPALNQLAKDPPQRPAQP